MIDKEKITQLIRTMDVAFIGPFLIIVGLIYLVLPGPVRFILVILGALIISYNLNNYIESQKAQKNVT